MSSVVTASGGPLSLDTDLATIAGTLRRRWWVFPLAIIAAQIFFALAVTDDGAADGYYVEERIFHAVDSTDVLRFVDLPAQLAQPQPSLPQLVEVVNDSEDLRKLRATFELLSLRIALRNPSVVLHSDNGTNGLVKIEGQFESSLAILCTEKELGGCAQAIDGARQILLDRFVAAQRRGIEHFGKTVSLLRRDSRVDAAYVTKLLAAESALRAMTEQSLIRLDLVESSSFVENELTTESSLGLGLAWAIALLIGMLVVLQWSIIDKRIFGVQRLARLTDEASVLGALGRKNDKTNTLSVAAALSRLAVGHESIRLVHIESVSSEWLAKLTQLVQANIILTAFSDLSVSDLARTDLVNCLLAQRGRTDGRELQMAWQSLSISSGVQPALILTN